MKKMIFLLLTLLSVTQQNFAQKGANEHPQPSPEMRMEMRNYIEQNVQPVLLAAQKAFDDQLSSEDLTFIKKKRQAFTTLQTKRMARHQQVEKLLKEGKSREEVSEILGLNREEMQSHRKTQMKEMKPFMERNESVLKNTMKTLKPSYEKWIAEEKSIAQEYIPEAGKAKKGRRGHKKHIGLFGLVPPQMHGLHHGKRGGKETCEGKNGKKENGEEGKRRHKKHARGTGKKGKGERGKHRLAMQFILWDGELPPNMEQNIGKKGFKAKGIQNAVVQSYPNPAKNSTTISADLQETAKSVDITFRNQAGKMVRNFTFKNISKGFNEFDLDLNNLPAGVYFYTFETDTFIVTKRLVVGE